MIVVLLRLVELIHVLQLLGFELLRLGVGSVASVDLFSCCLLLSKGALLKHDLASIRYLCWFCKWVIFLYMFEARIGCHQLLVGVRKSDRLR